LKQAPGLFRRRAAEEKGVARCTGRLPAVQIDTGLAFVNIEVRRSRLAGCAHVRQVAKPRT